ncbi:peptide-methionine (S)-S-oxide reductase MsrA [Methylocystis sp. ATCC 49242]|uniref:peptide-methionine (S)-S-oxide reductase MsrA n=1 Tax=Methylocystis sp. ATCC 49242 TaxID=622637 RepID=UPI0001F88815|nr:peptide-methionine (S)-S-oxide reductase MsrA [Methylocystis sp. ATCC 49242]
MKRVALFAAAIALLATPLRAAERAVSLPPPAYDPAPATPDARKLVVAGGCFWGVQGVFQHVKGVTRAVSGYAGGAKETAHYERVGRGDTGHAESVEITYDPGKVSLGELLRVYFSVAHDPTQLDRQGPDVGTQYRSAIFVADAEQEKMAREYIAQLSSAKAFPSPIVTRIERLGAFYPAEAYHQDYLVRHPDAPYIVFNDLPKIENLKRLYPAIYRGAPALTKN